MFAKTFKTLFPVLIILAGTAWAPLALAQEASGIPGIPAFTVTPGEEGNEKYSVTLQILALMTALTFLPAMLMMMTSFTRIIVVFAILRQALGLQATPSNQILLGLALFLSIFIMKPVLEEANEVGLQPYLQEEVTSLEAVKLASEPFKKFMLEQTREDELGLFMRISDVQDETAQDVSFLVLMPAFFTSELKTALQIRFILFFPFLLSRMVVACVWL
ncbi:MAG: flagellar type III secretion system pore protein FliP, partial [Alteromonadaceae bacterium]|nr:flagellar type III secretion system pore protein FliP [Alteromonadaceae bacterium]